MIKITKLKKKFNILEITKWSFLSLLIIISIFCNYYCIQHSDLLRSIILTGIITLSIGMIFLTKLGKKFLMLIKDSQQEIKLITWPNLKETLHITCIVIIATILISLIIWGLDNVLIILISLITSIRL